MKEIRSYIDEAGRKVTAFLEVDPETLEVSTSKPIYKGSFHVETNMGPMPLGFNFPEEYTMTKCFEEFDTLAQKAIDDKNKEIAEKNIIAAPENKGNIIIPGQ